MSKISDRRKRFLKLADLLGRQKLTSQFPHDDDLFLTELLRLADRNMVSAALLGAFTRAGLIHHLPTEFEDCLAAIHELNVHRSRAHIDEALAIHKTLSQKDIRHIFLKGTAYHLAGLMKDDPGQRLTSDIDILIEPDQIETALAAVVSLGYKSSEPDPGNILEVEHHLPRLMPDQNEAQFGIELHRGVVDQHLDHLLPAAKAFESMSFVEIHDQKMPIPGRRTMLTHAVIHAALSDHGFVLRKASLRYAMDIAKLCAGRSRPVRFTDDVDAQPILREKLTDYVNYCLFLVSMDEKDASDQPKSAFAKQACFRTGFGSFPVLERRTAGNLRALRDRPSEYLGSVPSRILRRLF